MSPESFTYWLQGFLEVTGATTITPEQVQIIKDHLALVFEKKTPSYQPIPPNYFLDQPLIVTC